MKDVYVIRHRTTVTVAGVLTGITDSGNFDYCYEDEKMAQEAMLYALDSTVDCVNVEDKHTTDDYAVLVTKTAKSTNGGSTNWVSSRPPTSKGTRDRGRNPPPSNNERRSVMSGKCFGCVGAGLGGCPYYGMDDRKDRPCETRTQADLDRSRENVRKLREKMSI